MSNNWWGLGQPSRSTIRAVVKRVAEEARIAECLFFPPREQRRYHRSIARARWRVWTILKETGRYSSSGIARATGCDHSSVIHGVNRLATDDRSTPRWLRARQKGPVPKFDAQKVAAE